MSLFSGIGGFELAAEWMGWNNLVSCEINDFGRKVLDYYWPNGYHHDDIHTLTYDKINEELTRRYGEDWRSDDVILTGGFPCQPYSAAGKRLGKEDDRHLWPQMLRIIREVRPKWVVGENVLGLVNWNGGLVFDEVQADLEAEGYEVQPYVLPAASVGAPHRRDRVWFVAHRTDSGFEGMRRRRQDAVYGLGTSTDTSKLRFYTGRSEQSLPGDSTNGKKEPSPDTDCDGHDEQSKTRNNAKRKNNKQSGSQRISTVERPCDEWDVTDTTNDRLLSSGSSRNGRTRFENCGSDANRDATDSDVSRCETKGKQPITATQDKRISDSCGWWDGFPTEPPVRGRNDGFSSELVGITVSKHRNESIKAYGNAICPQVAHQIFKAIQQYKDATD